MSFYPVAATEPQAAVGAITPPYPLTITGVSAATAALPGPLVTPSAGQVYKFEAWGTITTTVDTQTVNAALYLGGIGGTSIFASGVLNPNSGATVSGAAVRFTGTVEWLTATETTAEMQTDLNFFPASVSQSTAATLTTAGQQLVLALTPSATAVSVTINGGYWQRVA